MKKNIVIIGAGGHSKVLSDIVSSLGYNLCGFLDDTKTEPGIIGELSDYEKYLKCEFVIGIGDNYERKRIASNMNCKFASLIHPTAIVSPSVKLGEGTVVMPNAVVNAASTIGKHCIINTSSVVEHDCRLGDYVHISPGAVLCGKVDIGNLCHIGAGVVVKDKISIVSKCTIGISAGVVKNINQPGVYYGVPAKEKRISVSNS